MSDNVYLDEKQGVLEMDNEVNETAEERQERVYSEKEWKGLLGDKTSETRARQEAQADVARLRAEIAVLKDQKTSTPEESGGDPEDVVTNAALNKRIASLENKLLNMYQKEKNQEKEQTLKERIDESFEKAKGKYTEEKAGKGLTFDEVWEGTQRMIKNNDGYKYAIAHAKNPGEEAYKIGLRDEIIAQRYETYKNKLPPSGVTPKKGLESPKVPGAFYTPQMVQKMSDQEIDQHYEEILESQKNWGKSKKQ
jgi:hypothetical protein